MIENNGLLNNDNDSESQNSPCGNINEEKIDEKQIENKRPNKRKQTFERKNIRYIIDEEKFGKDAKEAQKAEFERLKRVQEKEQNIRLQNLLSDDFQKLPKNSVYQTENTNTFDYNNYIKLAPSRLPPASALLPGHGYKKYNNVNKQYRVVSDDCVIYVDDSDEDQEQFKSQDKTEIIEISDGEDEEDEREDVIDQEKLDIINMQRNTMGRILINKSHPSDEEDYFLSPKINASIKPHQVCGIRFLYDNLVESKKQFREADGFGCILAHSMGLGKTIQIIGFLDILFRCVNANTTMVIVPINTIQNWQAEIDHWLPLNYQETDSEVGKEDQTDNVNNGNPGSLPNTGLRPFSLFVIRDTNKTIESRHAVIKQWMEQGGVLLIGYEMFRLLVTYRQSKTAKPSKRKEKESTTNAPKRKICIDIELEEKRDGIYQDFLKALVNPGPEVVICDEGHRIKNSEASISKALKAVRTHRRVVMTGYPLQNNLTEYWCMVDFVRPNYLGSKHEFNNMFQRPIENGQCVDSTFEDRKLMQGRAHVLHELLEGFVQRRSHAVLKANLPPKWEYVILIKMSPFQRRLYSSFMDQLLNGSLYNWAQNNTLRTYAMCCKIWNHPDILFRVLKEQKASRPHPDFDFDIDDELPNNAKSAALKSKLKPRSKDPRRGQTIPSPATLESTEEDSLGRLETDSNSTENPPKVSMKENGHVSSSRIPAHTMSYSSYLESIMNKDGDNIDPYSWVSDDLWFTPNGEPYQQECRSNSGKIVIFLGLLEESIRYGDKMLVFSQSLLTLDLIEVFLKQSSVRDTVAWEKNRTYFRLDGSTSATERERMIKSFNEKGSDAFLFLLSTRAGCLGINLIGANRVVVFDASWNPCHDCQAVCRVYRYGQNKPCFIYRLVTDNTIEKKIYDRQITKQGISDRVVDESNPGQQFTRSQVQVLVQYEDRDIPGLSSDSIDQMKRGCGEEDPVLGRILENYSNWVTRVPFTHESLLIDRKDYRLTRREKRKAKERYELDKRQSLYYQKNSYSDYYIKTTVPVNEPLMQNRPPITAYRSSILPTMMNNSSIGSSGGIQNRFHLNKNLARSQNIMVRPNSALLREIEQARLRCGFTKNTPGPFPIAVSDDEDDPIVIRKKQKLNSDSDPTAQKAPSIDQYPKADVPKKVSYSNTNKADSSSELKTDKNFKVVKITATTELNFPSTPSVVNSQAGQETKTKISVGEPLEIIYTTKGKFLRVSRTGDLFAIKDTKASSKSTSAGSKENLPEKVYEDSQSTSSSTAPQLKDASNGSQPAKSNPGPLVSLFDMRDPNAKPVESSGHAEPTSYGQFYKPPAPVVAQYIAGKTPGDEIGLSYPISYSEPTSSPMLPPAQLFAGGGTHSNGGGQVCCQCQLPENGCRFLPGCMCPCHHQLGHHVGHMPHVTSGHQHTVGLHYPGVGGGSAISQPPQTLATQPTPSSQQQQQAVFVSQFPGTSPLFFTAATATGGPQSSSQMLPQAAAQFVMTSLSNSFSASPQFFDEHHRGFGGLLSINPRISSGGGGPGPSAPGQQQQQQRQSQLQDPSGWLPAAAAMGLDRFHHQVDHGPPLATTADQLSKSNFSSYDFSDL